ncbi:MAG: hypothetical protein AB7H92_15205 [Microbacteriaceae bacterium]
MTRPRPAALAAAILLLAGALTGCSAILPEVYGPERGQDGRVAKMQEAAATWLAVGDCFRFADEEDLGRVTLLPCSTAHDWEVIAQGDLTLREEKELGVQSVVSGYCADPFAAFAETAGDDAWQQFLLSQAERENRTVTVYTCIATATVPEP